MHIDLRQELQNYKPIDLEGIVGDGRNVSDNTKNSIMLYNKALENIKSGSEDIAIIELKKAVAMNQEFYEANNLLGLCYIYIKEYNKASELFDKVIQNEKNGAKAFEYLNRINSDDLSKPLPGKNEKHNKVLKAPDKAVPKSMPIDWTMLIKNFLLSGDRFYVKYLVGFILGGLLVFLIFNTVLSLNKSPKATDNNPSINQDVYNKVNADKTEQKPVITGPEVEKNEKYIKLKKELDEAKKKLSYYDGVKSLSQIETLISERKFEEAADKLVTLKNLEFSAEDKARYDSMAANTFPRVSWIVYDEGKKLFNAGNYEAALKRLIKLMDYGGKWEYTPDAYYSIGKCFMVKKDFKSAIAMFEKVKNDYPNDVAAKEAQDRIDEIKHQQGN